MLSRWRECIVTSRFIPCLRNSERKSFVENMNVAPVTTSSLKILTVGGLVDILSRLLPASIFFLIVLSKMNSLINYVRMAEVRNLKGGQLAFYAAIGSQSSVILFLLVMVVLFVIRTSPIKKAQGLFPRVTAIVGTFLMSIITIFPRASLGLWPTVTATALVLFGTILSIYVLTQLGRSFSLMAEARRLVTGGPYAIVRHPLYLAEEIAMLGTALQYFSLFTMLIFVIHLLVQIQRMKNEEAVLHQIYPEYSAYQARTARLISKIY